MMNRLNKVCFLGTCLYFFCVASTRANPVVLPILSLPNLNDWEPQVFSSETLYEPIQIDGRQALKARSHASASGLFREVAVDLTQTPWLNWSWKVDSPLLGNDETSKRGDDFAVWVYVIASGGWLFRQTRAICYVWANGMPKHSTWPNPYSNNSRMVALESGSELAGKWVSERRNILKDFKTEYGLDISRIHSVAVMTDSDNTGQVTIGYYGNIFFTSE